MAFYKTIRNPFTGDLQLVFNGLIVDIKGAVASQANLPLSGNTKGDARITSDTGHLYVWIIDFATGDLSDWDDQGDIIDVDWSVLTNKPASSVTNIDDAVTKRHVQGTDQALDTGGANEVSAEQAKAGYTHSGVVSGNPHSVSKSDVGLGNVDNVSEATIISDVKSDVDVADAISKKHTQNTDTQLDSGVVAVDGSDNVVILQNSVNPFQSVAASAVANTLVLKEGAIGIGTDNPSTLLYLQSATSSVLTIENTGDSSTQLILDADRSSAGISLGLIRAYWNGTEISRIGFQSGADTSNKDDGDIRFYTRDDGDASVQERFRVTQNGLIGIGTDSPDARLEVEVANTKNQMALLVTQSDVTNNPIACTITNTGTNHALRLLQTGVLASGDYGCFIYSNAIQVNSYLFYINQENASSTANVVYIKNDGTGNGLTLSQIGNGIAQEINNDGTNHGLYIHQDGVLAAAKNALYVYSNAVQVNSELLKIRQNNYSSTAVMSRFDNLGTGTTVEIVSAGVLAAGKVNCWIYSNAIQTNSPLLLVQQDNASSTADVAEIDNDGTGHGLYLHQDGNLATGKYALYVDNNGTPIDGAGRAIRLDGCTVSSTKDPTTDAPDGFIGINIDGVQKAVPYYALS